MREPCIEMRWADEEAWKPIAWCGALPPYELLLETRAEFAASRRANSARPPCNAEFRLRHRHRIYGDRS